MDVPSDSQPDLLNPQADLLSALAVRVSELEREVAALRADRDPARRRFNSPFGHREHASAPTAREFQPLPLALQQMLPEADRASQTPPPPKAPALPPRSLEDRLGAQVFNRVGIVALLIAASWGLKLAFENQLIGPIGRIVIGLLAGAGLVLWSERFRRKGFPAFSWSLKAVGTGVLYLTLWAAFQIYAILPASVALILMIAVTAWNAFMAWSQDSELLAAYALSGAFATPLLLSTGGNHEPFLFTYLGAIDLATLLLVRLKPWPRLLLSALVGTMLFYGGWYLRFYDFVFRSSSNIPPFAVTSAFVLGFAAIFALASIRGFLRWKDDPAAPTDRFLGRSPAILSVIVPLLNAAFLALALALLVKGKFQSDLLPWLMVALAAVYLGLMRVQRTLTASALHLAFAVVFLTIAIPLKASGHTLTFAWFAEGLALLWVSTRIGPGEADPASSLTPPRILRTLAWAGYALGFLSLIFSRFLSGQYDRTDFLSADLFAALFAAGTLLAAVWLILHPRSEPARNPSLPIMATLAFFGVDAVALLLSLREFDVRPGDLEQAFLNADFPTVLVALLLLGGSALLLLRLAPASDRPAFTRLAAINFILFNLLALLSGVVEIGSLWHSANAGLQRSLAISSFLMLYGAILLAVGFVRRSAFTRWQALILLVFTILKVFLYDISSLSQGYRVLSFLLLGVLLMAVSFAYQKDWLGLKSPPTQPMHPEVGQ